MTIRSRVPSQIYKDNWDKIFGKQEKPISKVNDASILLCRYCLKRLPNQYDFICDSCKDSSQ